MSEAPSNALQAVLAEIKNISPELKDAFIFRKDGEVVAGNPGDGELQIKRLEAAFSEIVGQAEVIGDVEGLTIQGVNSQLTITSMANRYLATVSSRLADEKMVKALTGVIVPTVISLVDQLSSLSSTQTPVSTEIERIDQFTTLPEQPKFGPSVDANSPSSTEELILPNPPANQFMVEKIGGLLVASDIVRVDADVVAKWHDLYGNREITQVHVETLEGKTVACRYKVMKREDGRSKGMIQIPDKILQILRTGEGKLVVVKPVISLDKENKR